jgi:K+-transporting ATPase ATPase C chain
VSSVLGVLTLIVVCGLLYPLVVTGVGQVAFPGNANGQQVRVHGKLVGSKIIGQSFASPVYKHGKEQLSDGVPVTTPDPRYFQTRPSGTTPADNDAATSFANYGPNSTVTEKALAANIAAYIALNGKYYPGGLTAGKVPVDAADTSASGVDPDISVANARIQAYRIAAERHLPLAKVDALIATYTAGRGLGFSGEPAVDVLELNLALDRL